MSGIMFVTTSFEQTTKHLDAAVRTNTLLFGKSIAAQFKENARQDAPWTDRKGNARSHFTGDAEATGMTVRVTMAASAPNYKRGAHSSPDYMEYLEFGFGGQYAVVYPEAEAMMKGIREKFGAAALRGSFRTKISRDKSALRRRKARYRAMANGTYFKTGKGGKTK